MSDFTPITTQEEFDQVISKRLQRERATIEKEFAAKYADYDDLKKAGGKSESRIQQLEKELADEKAAREKETGEYSAKIKTYETASVKARIAHETGIPYEMASRLTGDDEEAIRKDAEAIKSLIGTSKGYTPPEPSKEPAGENKETAAYRSLLQGLKGEN